MLHAQNKSDLFYYNDSTSINIKKIKDTISLKTELYKKGYFFYTIAQKKRQEHTEYTVNLGKQTKIITVHNLSKKVQKQANLNHTTIHLKPNQFNQWTEQLINQLDKSGNSFSKISYKNHKISNDTLHCELHQNLSKQRFVDKITIKGYTRFSKRFIKRYLKTKKPFSTEQLLKIEQKINHLTFVENKKTPQVLFTKDSTSIYLFLNRIKANKLDALLGFSNQENNNKLQFNGYINIALNNILHKGESFTFKWNNSGLNQQEIDLTIDNPFIFNSPININYHLNIYRQDSTFVNTSQQIQLTYQPHYRQSIGAYFNNQNSTSFNNTTDNQNFSKNIIGVNYTYKQLNNWKFPKSKLELDFGYGNRKTNTKEIQLSFGSETLYDFKLTPLSHLFVKNRNQYLKSDKIATNELYRTGGATTIRGFTEQSITSYLYNFSNIEYRFFTNPISYLYLFSDFGHFKNLETDNNLTSLGLGYTLGTKNGLLNINYAVGKNQNQTFNFNNGLVHLNFITLF